MIDMNAISASLAGYQQRVRGEMGLKAIKQAAEAEQAIADMLEENARAVEQMTSQSPSTKSSISIYA